MKKEVFQEFGFILNEQVILNPPIFCSAKETVVLLIGELPNHLKLNVLQLQSWKLTQNA